MLIINDLSPRGLRTSLGDGELEVFLRKHKNHVFYTRSVIPHENYVWWEEKDRYTKEGYLYEVNLMNALCSAIDCLVNILTKANGIITSANKPQSRVAI